jgi:hypothetical protein
MRFNHSFDELVRMHSTAIPRLQSVLACVAVAVWSCAGASSAATIKGRVVDSSQHPIAGAEVRILRKAETAGKRLENQLILAGRAAALRTDDAGCFEVADLPDLGQSIRVVIQSEAILVVSSHWIPAVGREAINVGDLTARRLATVTGRVVDRQRSPVEGATVVWPVFPRAMSACSSSEQDFAFLANWLKSPVGRLS